MVQSGKIFCCPSHLKEIDQAIDRLELVVSKFISHSKSSLANCKNTEELEHLLTLEKKEKLELANACRMIALRLEKVGDKMHEILSGPGGDTRKKEEGSELVNACKLVALQLGKVNNKTRPLLDNIIIGKNNE